MKTVNKFIMLSYILCYFAGVYFISVKFGLIKLISRYGLSEVFDAIPKSFPEMNYLYVGLILFTLLYVLLGFWVYGFLKNNEAEIAVLQDGVMTVCNYKEEMNALIFAYTNLGEPDKKVINDLQQLLRLVASLPSSAVQTQESQVLLRNAIDKLRCELAQNDSDYSVAIASFRNTVNYIQRRCVTIK